ncbi:MAG: PAS domain S-box protein [Microscillaceae bacterium]|jgi:PAS domain S-box-containing protein|nr:PAS domain S-box protein [Microscillaceae bacterium]
MIKQQFLLDTFLTNSYDAVLLFDRQLYLVDKNEAFDLLFQLDTSALLTQKITDLYPFLTDFETSFQQALQGERLAIEGKSFRREPTFSKFLWEARLAPIWGDSGEIEGGMAIFRKHPKQQTESEDFTKKRLKDALQAYEFSTDRLKCIINSTQDYTAAIDTHFRFILFNDRFKAYFEAYTGKKIAIGVNILDCLTHLPETYEQVKYHWERVLSGKEYQLVEKIKDGSGRLFYAEMNFGLVKDRNNKIIGASQVIRDITERVRNEELRLTSERRFSKAFQEAGVGFVLVDLKTNLFIQANPAFCHLLGYTQEELRSLQTKDITQSDDFKAENQLMSQLLQGQITTYNIEKRLYHKSGREIWASVSGTLLNDIRNQPEFGLGVVVDISTQKQTQKKLSDSESQNRALIEALPDMIFKLSAQGTVLSAKANIDSLKFSKSDILAKNISDFPLPKKLKDRLLKLITRAIDTHNIQFYECEIPIQQKLWAFEARFMRSNDHEAVVIVRDITKRKQEEAKIKELLEKERWYNQSLAKQNEELAQKEDELAQMNQRLQRQYDVLSRATEALKISQAELEKTLHTLEERNFELDQFVYKTSHDLRSPLSSILGMIHLLKIEPDQSVYPEYIERIEGRINRLDEFIQSMLNYSRNTRAELKREPIDYEEIIENCLEDLKYYKGFEEVTKQCTISGSENEFCSDPLRIKIICNNLISNAIKYQDFAKTQRKLDIDIAISPQQTVLTFTDNGIGIHAEYLHNISKMFYRATEEAEGSGLGMYIVRQTVDKLSGEIYIHSEGHLQGLTVTVEIPNRKKIDEV